MKSVKTALITIIINILMLSSGYALEKGRLVHIPWDSDIVKDQVLELGLDIWEVREGKALVYLRDSNTAVLDESGISYTVLPDGFLGRDVPGHMELRAPADDGAFHNFTELVADMQALAVANSAICSITSIGQSLEVRDVWVLKISDNVSVDEDEAEVLLLFLQHAREWISGEVGWGIAHNLVDNYASDAGVQAIVDNSEIYLVICANPDGREYSSSSERSWRKNRRNNGDGSYGIDPNRNFPKEFYSLSYVTYKSSNTYGGPAPLSEPISSALHDFVAARDFVIAVNYHSYGQEICYPWGYTEDPPPNLAFYLEICNGYKSALEAVPGSVTYNITQWSYYYEGAGATDDWLAADMGVPCITLELRPYSSAGGGFVLPESQIQPTIDENLGGADYIFNWAMTQHEDATAPAVSNESLDGLTYNSVQLSWNTDDYADTGAGYGQIDPSQNQAQTDLMYNDSHSITITGLMPETHYYVQVQSTNLAGLTGYGTVMEITTPAVPGDIDLVIDNIDPGFTASGPWLTKNSLSGIYDSDYRYFYGTPGTGSAAWEAVIPVDGMYEVYIYYPDYYTHSEDACFTVSHSTGDAEVYIDQTLSGGSWNMLGTFHFYEGPAQVSLSSDTLTGTAVADAVRFFRSFTEVGDWYLFE